MNGYLFLLPAFICFIMLWAFTEVFHNTVKAADYLATVGAVLGLLLSIASIAICIMGILYV